MEAQRIAKVVMELTQDEVLRAPTGTDRRKRKSRLLFKIL